MAVIKVRLIPSKTDANIRQPFHRNSTRKKNQKPKIKGGCNTLLAHSVGGAEGVEPESEYSVWMNICVDNPQLVIPFHRSRIILNALKFLPRKIMRGFTGIRLRRRWVISDTFSRVVERKGFIVQIASLFEVISLYWQAYRIKWKENFPESFHVVLILHFQFELEQNFIF